MVNLKYAPHFCGDQEIIAASTRNQMVQEDEAEELASQDYESSESERERKTGATEKLDDFVHDSASECIEECSSTPLDVSFGPKHTFVKRAEFAINEPSLAISTVEHEDEINNEEEIKAPEATSQLVSLGEPTIAMVDVFIKEQDVKEGGIKPGFFRRLWMFITCSSS